MKTLIVGLCLLAGAAQANNCDTTMAQQELNRCAALAFQAADGELNDAYAEAVKFARAIGGEAEEKLRAAQRAWVAFRDAACDAEAYPNEGGTMQPMVYSYCLTRLTDVRRADLINFASQY
jgi:uncharacterized protein YecT (DUF1311 family)